jgi:hypothetical protein
MLKHEPNKEMWIPLKVLREKQGAIELEMKSLNKSLE